MKKYLTIASIVILIATLAYAQYTNQMDEDLVQKNYRRMVPEAVRFEPITDRTAKAMGGDGSVIAYLGIDSNTG